MWRGGAKISILLVAMKKYLPAPCLFNSISFGCCCRTGPSVILTGAHTHITCRMQGGSVGVCVGGKAQSGTLGSRQNCFLHDFPWWHHTGCTACPQAQCWHRNVGGLSPCLSCDGRIHCSFRGSGRGSLSLLYQAELWSMQGPSHASHLPRPQPDISHLGRIYLQLIFLFFYWEIFRHFQK